MGLRDGGEGYEDGRDGDGRLWARKSLMLVMRKRTKERLYTVCPATHKDSSGRKVKIMNTSEHMLPPRLPPQSAALS